MTAVAPAHTTQPDPVSKHAPVCAHLKQLSNTWTIKKIENNSLKSAPGPSGVAHRIALWLDEWSMRSFSHDSHHWSAKSEVLRGLKNIGQQVGH